MKTPTRDLVRQALHGYAEPGGYPLYMLTDAGDVLCPSCVKTEVRSILHAIRTDYRHTDWYPLAVDANWEDPALYCDHCGQRIKSAYAEDEAETML